MNTLQAISSSRRLNRNFWNSEVLFRIVLIRTNTYGDKHVKLLRRGLKAALKNRSNFEYLD